MGDNPERLDSEASFAALCGVGPVECSSGRRNRVHPSAGQLAHPGPLRAADPGGQYRRGIVRCLKRYAAREVFHLVKQLQPDPRS
ncbi:hypothetical protein ACFVOR_08935 [Streptomyces sp. NPDC057837]|uniref:hypothetical protein n=1 Tax=Streptomyces sp. NPDC057837 TaxID=3346260 RepID=UPI003692B404